MRPRMTGERVPATRLAGGVNGNGSGGSHYAFGVFGPRRERRNRAAKRQANGQRRTQDRAAITRSISEWV